MKLIVKGNRAEALHAADRHRVPALWLTGLFGQSQSVLGVPERYHARVVEWFGEWREQEEGFGYPTGTLLWFAARREGDVI